jgi:hypothetical protein
MENWMINKGLIYLRWAIIIIPIIGLTFTICYFLNRNSGLEVIVDLNKKSFCIDEKILINAKIVNNGKIDLLIDNYWSLMPKIKPPIMSSGALIVKNIFGKIINIHSKIDRHPVTKEDFIILAPGASISRSTFLQATPYADIDNPYSYQFQENGIYSVTVVYQNALKFTQQFFGNNKVSWAGKATATRFFYINSDNCLGKNW